ncbi:ImmA/IrrE family metallo-endopeptidase [Microbacterium sp. SLBN-111]|uniref:ImmA/IrrE family metallo-endopeptidase n=1 Tax=Microbacterium sp. SLBN-111 TaxID=3377733 RepID=UPI003C74F563
MRIEYSLLPPDRDGEYRHRHNAIRLRRGMSSRLHRSVLAHELAHAVFGHVPSRFGPEAAKQERVAEEWAALRPCGQSVTRTTGERRSCTRATLAR